MVTVWPSKASLGKVSGKGKFYCSGDMGEQEVLGSGVLGSRSRGHLVPPLHGS